MSGDILCAIDFSDASRETVRWAADLARQLNSHLTILYVYRLNHANGQAIALKRSIEKEAMTRFADLENELLKGQGVPYDFKAEVGFVSDRVEFYTKTRPVRFLVIERRPGNREQLDDLMANVSVPLIIVPHPN